MLFFYHMHDPHLQVGKPPPHGQHIEAAQFVFDDGQGVSAGVDRLGGDDDKRSGGRQLQVVGSLPHTPLLERPPVQQRVDEQQTSRFVDTQPTAPFLTVAGGHRGGIEVLGGDEFGRQRPQHFTVKPGVVGRFGATASQINRNPTK